MPLEWHGSVIARPPRRHLYLKIKIAGVWRMRRTKYLVGEEAQAEALLAEVREQLMAEEAALAGAPGPVTVRAWSKKWLSTRTSSRKDDESVLKTHVLPEIGDSLLVDVASRHILEMVRRWQPKDAHGNRAAGAAAPRTVRNWYSTTACMFRDAALEGLIKTTPCILATPHLPPAEDADSEWRVGARFTRAELEVLISPHELVEEARRSPTRSSASPTCATARWRRSAGATS
jgi:hypothetical protein